jgi:lipid-A-disaccharide synthase-like uncharacterized protein
MPDLLLIYAALAIFDMPLQENYWFWKVIGFAGLGVFQARWVVQWLYSEKHRESKVPPVFWWLSMVGALLETCYFLRQKDSVGIAGYCISAVPYTRNLMLVYSKKKRDAAAAGRGFDVITGESAEE